MGYVIDRYTLNLFCICLDCENRGVPGKAKSCSAYPKENGIPPEIWNTKNAECKHFKEKHPKK